MTNKPGCKRGATLYIVRKRRKPLIGVKKWLSHGTAGWVSVSQNSRQFPKFASKFHYPSIPYAFLAEGVTLNLVRFLGMIFWFLVSASAPSGFSIPPEWKPSSSAGGYGGQAPPPHGCCGGQAPPPHGGYGGLAVPFRMARN